MILPPGGLLRQVQRLQHEAARVKAELAQKTVTIDVGAGLVRVTIGGDMRLRHIAIAPQALENRELLEDLLVTGVNKALEAAQEMVQQAMQPYDHLVAGGLDAIVSR
jgi:DNA-binding YbaB/EbfC family protein